MNQLIVAVLDASNEIGGNLVRCTHTPHHRVALTSGLIAMLLWVCATEATAAGNDRTRSTKEMDPGFIEVVRPIYRFRHWEWSGIFPIFGGWIADPHFLSTPVFEFPQPVRDQLLAKEARYQGFDVNPWFRDESTEVVFAVEVDGQPYSFSIDAPRAVDDSPVAFASSHIEILSIPNDRGLLLFTVLRRRYSCFIEISLPLPSAYAQTRCEGSKEWEQTLESLIRSGYVPPKDRLCGNKNRQTKKFYERFGSPCTKA